MRIQNAGKLSPHFCALVSQQVLLMFVLPLLMHVGIKNQNNNRRFTMNLQAICELHFEKETGMKAYILQCILPLSFSEGQTGKLPLVGDDGHPPALDLA